MNPLILTCLAFFLVSLNTTIIFVAFPAIQIAFAEASLGELGWVLNVYAIIFGSFLIPAGAYSDQYGRKRFFILGVSLFTVASLLCGMSASIHSLIVFRAIQAIGAALLIPSSLALVLTVTPLEKRAVAVSIWGAVGAFAAALGPAFGAFLIESSGWRSAFFIHVPFGILSIILSLFCLEDSREPQSLRPSIIASILLALTLISFSIAFSRQQESSLSQLLFWIFTGFVLLIFFIFFNLRVKNPAMDFSLFREKTILASNIGTFAFGVAFSMMFLSFVFFLTHIWMYRILYAGLALTPGPLAVIPTAILAGKYAARHGHGKLVIVGALIFILGMLLRLLWPMEEENFILGWLPAMILTGVGTGLLVPSFTAAATYPLPKERYAMGSGINGSLRQCGSVGGVALVIFLMTTTQLKFQSMFIYTISFTLIAGLSGFWIKTKPKPAGIV